MGRTTGAKNDMYRYEVYERNENPIDAEDMYTRREFCKTLKEVSDYVKYSQSYISVHIRDNSKKNMKGRWKVYKLDPYLEPGIVEMS